jgi:hypothetical protein
MAVSKLTKAQRLAGFLGPVLDSKFFISSQLPTPYKGTPDLTTTLIAWQLGNAYLLLGLLGVLILNTTTEPKVVHAYIWALWLGDIGHVGFTLYAMGWQDSLDISRWNPVIWGNVGATVFLFANRCLYLLGFFGPDRVPRSRANERKVQ